MEAFNSYPESSLSKFMTISSTTLVVTTTLDQNNGNLSDGLSLREAILIANANPDTAYTIQLQGGLTYRK